MRVLLVNKFFYLKGGSEHVFFDTVRLLEQNGHKPVFFSMKHPLNFHCRDEKYFVSNVGYQGNGIFNKLDAGLKILYSLESKRKIAKLIKDRKPDIAHLNNIYHQISPSILHALKKNKIPVVMTLHDSKMVCASYYLQNHGMICQACKDKRYYHCFLNGCVKNCRMKSLISTLEMYLHHSILHIYELIDIFISPSLFLKEKLEEMGFKGKVIYLPNFIDTQDLKPEYSWQENSIVYFGRLSPEKGLATLIDAVKDINGVFLNIIGDGPARENLEKKLRDEKIKNVYFLGYKSGEDLKREIVKSKFVVCPSECLENNPRSIIEAFALGKPVIGSIIGGIPEIIKDNDNGMLFEPGNAVNLRTKMEYLCKNNPSIGKMGRNARSFVENSLNPQKHYQGLMSIYEQAMSKHR